MLNKKRLKFRRIQKKKVNTGWVQSNKNVLNFGQYGIRAQEAGILTKRQIEAARRTLTRQVKKYTKVWIKSRINRNVTAKPQGIRMGKGKGSVSQKTRFVSKGEILIEIGSISKKKAINSLKKIYKKLPIKIHVISKGR